jgi:metal-responsive CopG/Arc/MetJ family transcriptional regulator
VVLVQTKGGPAVEQHQQQRRRLERRMRTMSFTKISVNLSDEVLQALREMAQRDNVTVTEALRRSISTQKFLEDEQRAGKLILIEDPKSKEKQRIVFR